MKYVWKQLRLGSASPPVCYLARHRWISQRCDLCVSTCFQDKINSSTAGASQCAACLNGRFLFPALIQYFLFLSRLLVSSFAIRPNRFRLWFSAFNLLSLLLDHQPDSVSLPSWTFPSRLLCEFISGFLFLHLRPDESVHLIVRSAI